MKFPPFTVRQTQTHPPTQPPHVIRVLWVDDCERIAAAWARLIAQQPDMVMTECLMDTRSIVPAVQRHHPDVVVMDLDLAGHNALLDLPRIVSELPDLRVLIYSGSFDGDLAERCLNSGAWGLVGKHHDPADVLLAIRRVANGEAVFAR